MSMFDFDVYADSSRAASFNLFTDTPRDRRDQQEREELRERLERAMENSPRGFKLRIGKPLDYWGDWHRMAHELPLEFLQSWVWGPEGEFVALPSTPEMWQQADHYQRHAGYPGPNGIPFVKKSRTLPLARGVMLLETGFGVGRSNFRLLYIDNYPALQSQLDRMQSVLNLECP